MHNIVWILYYSGLENNGTAFSAPNSALNFMIHLLFMNKLKIQAKFLFHKKDFSSKLVSFKIHTQFYYNVIKWQTWLVDFKSIFDMTSVLVLLYRMEAFRNFSPKSNENISLSNFAIFPKLFSRTSVVFI